MELIEKYVEASKIAGISSGVEQCETKKIAVFTFPVKILRDDGTLSIRIVAKDNGENIPADFRNSYKAAIKTWARDTVNLLFDTSDETASILTKAVTAVDYLSRKCAFLADTLDKAKAEFNSFVDVKGYLIFKTNGMVPEPEEGKAIELLREKLGENSTEHDMNFGAGFHSAYVSARFTGKHVSDTYSPYGRGKRFEERHWDKIRELIEKNAEKGIDLNPIDISIMTGLSCTSVSEFLLKENTGENTDGQLCLDFLENREFSKLFEAGKISVFENDTLRRTYEFGNEKVVIRDWNIM